MLDQVTPGFDLARLQVSDSFPRHADFLGQRRGRQPRLKPHRPNAPADPAGAFGRPAGQTGEIFRVAYIR